MDVGSWITDFFHCEGRNYSLAVCHCEELATKQSLSGVLAKTLRLLRFARNDILKLPLSS